MRLIDADKLRQRIELIHFRNTREESIVVKALMAIDEQPTDYDVDKVVEELEEWEEDNVLGEFERGMNAMIKRAVKIVKRGGVDAN